MVRTTCTTSGFPFPSSKERSRPTRPNLGRLPSRASTGRSNWNRRLVLGVIVNVGRSGSTGFPMK
jgi:hypothetical protein